MGVTEDVVPTVAEWSLQDHSTATNPRPAAVEDFEAILRVAMG
jgi:alcohol dehydrogenase class IV